MASGTASPRSHQPNRRVRARPIISNNGSKVIGVYLVRMANPARQPASGPAHPRPLMVKDRSHHTSDHVQKLSIMTSHIRVVADTRNAGVTTAISVASSG